MRSFPVPARYLALAIPAVIAVAALAPAASAQEDAGPLTIAFA